MANSDWHYFDMPDLVWAKALVAALASAHGTAEWFDAIERGGGLLRSGFMSAKTKRILKRTRAQADIAAYKVPERPGYTVKAPRGAATSIGWSAFIQAYIVKSHEGYGQTLPRLPPGSRKVFPKESRRG